MIGEAAKRQHENLPSKQFFLRFLSYQILRHMHVVLNIDENKN